MGTETSRQGKYTALQSCIWVSISLVAMLWLLCAVIAFSNVEVDAFVLFGMFVWGIGIAVVWVLACFGSAWLLGKDLARHKRVTLLWALLIVVAPICGLLGQWLLRTDRDFVLRLKLSERALIERCEAVIADREQATTAEGWAGLLRIHTVSIDDADAVRLTTVYPGLFDEAGVYYDPDGVLAETSEQSEERSTISGPWKRFYWSD